jgi:predicted NACHT family NTPase
MIDEILKLHGRISELGNVASIWGLILAILFPIIIFVYKKYFKPQKKQVTKKYEQHYLKGLMEECANLEWLQMIRKQEDNELKIKLDNVYTPLLTHTQKETKGNKDSFNDKEVYSALEMLNCESKLVITGAPGSGKSAFVNFVALCLAGEKIKDKHCHVKLLTQPLPDEEGEPQKKKQKWKQKSLIPLRIILRDFASSKFFPNTLKEVKAIALMSFIELVFKDKTWGNYYPLLEKALLKGNVLVMFDGLDEVPEADARRERMKLCIEKFCTAYSRNRFLVTVRPYAYEKVEWKLSGFSETALANFNRGQIALFINIWYSNNFKIKM